MEECLNSATQRAWLALARCEGLSAARIRALLERFGGPDALLAAGAGAWRGAGVPEAGIAGLQNPDWPGVDADLAWLAGGAGRHLVCLDDPAYPPLLAALADAPLALFLLGDKAALRRPQLAIVGSRNPTALGQETARDFARDLAGAGLTITSGLALGIDGAAHEGALLAGTTIAVAGTGLDRVYPAKHRELAHRIAESGALVSEFPPGTHVRPGNFPRRNRLIAGLSFGVLVVEAAVASGSLITARLALDAGREVFAIPGSIHNPLAKGCHALIRQGAKLVETAQDVIEELGALAALHQDVANPVQTQATMVAGDLDATDQTILAAVDYAPTPVDEVVRRTGLSAQVVSGGLLGLELRGLLALCPGGYQRLAAPA